MLRLRRFGKLGVSVFDPGWTWITLQHVYLNGTATESTMQSWLRMFFLVILATSTGAWAADDGKISLYLECSKETPSSAELWLKDDSVQQHGPPKVCADNRYAVKDVYVESIDLREAPSMGTYALFIGVDKKRSEELYGFSSKPHGRAVILEKSGRCIDLALIGAPIRNAVIFLGVPSKDAGEQLGNLIFGAAGKPSK